MCEYMATINMEFFKSHRLHFSYFLGLKTNRQKRIVSVQEAHSKIIHLILYSKKSADEEIDSRKHGKNSIHITYMGFNLLD